MKGINKILSSLFFASLGAYAQSPLATKEVKLKWEKVPKSKAVEIQIYQGEKVVKTLTSKGSEIKVPLPTAFYEYTLRVIDIFDRPGVWSTKIPLAVLPPPPKVHLPKDGENIFTTRSLTKLEFSWKSSSSELKTLVQVKKSGREVLSAVVPGNSAELGPFAEGKYSWSVKHVLGDKDQYSTTMSEEFDFELERGELVVPTLISPKGTVVVAESTQGQSFEWEKVRGAKSYQFSIKSVDSGRKREGKLTENQIKIGRLPLGRYEWRVKAFSFVPGEFSESVPEKIIFSNFANFAPGIDFALGIEKGDNKYTIANPNSGANFSNNNGITTYNAALEVWYHPYYALNINGSYRKSQIWGQSANTAHTQILWKRRGSIQENTPWTFEVGGGADARQEKELIPRSSFNYRLGTLTFFGAAVTGAVQYNLGVKTRFVWNNSYFVPFLLTGPPAGTKLSGNNYSNYKTQLKASRNFWRAWWSLGINYDQRSASFLPLNSRSPAIVKSKIQSLFLEVSIPLYRGEK